MSIYLSDSDIDYILEEIDIADRVQPFIEREYLVDYVETRVLQSLPRKILPTGEELLETSEKLLELEALTAAYRSLNFHTITGLRRNTEETMERIIKEKRAEITEKEWRIPP